MSIIFTGVSAATVCAAPLGAFLGDLWGWRATFMVAGVIGLVALAVQLVTMPKVPPMGAQSLSTFLVLLRRPNI
ncbi:MFS transporter, partial [Acinetobacter baumannii]